ncbi:hypothetical protein [uncultured Marinobacter sp.]|uniref:hypothetical protein n=2 Tax=uncultured Marinobacter sp. TaxID=187379 RepID=UPI0025940D57|nr:hypothetical protein [uncultured Marinobacter sp.]
MMLDSVLKPKAPNNNVWRAREVERISEYPAIGFYHLRLKLFVISAVEVAEKEIGPEYHLSISKYSGPYSQPRRCSMAEAQMVLKQFDAEGAKEDNHTSLIRSFWMPVNESLVGIECECKDQEAIIREGDFEWRPLTKENAERAERLSGKAR